MDITITVSDRIGAVIKERAAEKDMGLADLASDLLEEKVIEEFSDDSNFHEPHPLLKMAGIFSSGKTDTSVNYKKILHDEIKMPGGFGGKE